MRILVSGLIALLGAIAMPAQDFTRTMTADEQAAAGLAKLSPAELAALKTAVERYKAGAVAVVQEQAEQQVAATAARAKEAERKAAAAEAKAKERAGEGGVATETAGKRPGWVGALLTLQRAEKAPEAEVLESRLAGELKTFRGRRNFHLEDGQVWQMIEAAEYAGPTLRNPVVTVRPGPMGAFWLKIPDGALRVKVKPLKLE